LAQHDAKAGDAGRYLSDTQGYPPIWLIGINGTVTERADGRASRKHAPESDFDELHHQKF
jgi:hypothetical protein